MSIETLVVHKGHPFHYSTFFAMFDENPDVNATAVEQPAAQVLLRPENVAPYETIVFYDMWGTESPDGGASFTLPSDDYKASIAALVESGKGIVMMNHALVQWPSWEGWRDMSGTSFMLTEGEVFGEVVPGSGYRGGGGEPDRNAHHHLSPVQGGHPVLEGLDNGFDIIDEMYIKTSGFESSPDILPLMRTDYPMIQENFNPPPLASAEEQARWSHPEGSNLIVWAKRTGNSPVVAMDAGDSPVAYENPDFRRLLSNAIHWVASEDARAWAQGS